MEVALTADVAVAQGLVVGCLVEESAIKAVLENRADRGDRASLDEDAASAGGIEARIVVAPGQRQDAETGARALNRCSRAPEGSWLARMVARKPPLLAAVALANRTARIAWALMAHGGVYKVPGAVGA